MLKTLSKINNARYTFNSRTSLIAVLTLMVLLTSASAQQGFFGANGGFGTGTGIFFPVLGEYNGYSVGLQGGAHYDNGFSIRATVNFISTISKPGSSWINGAGILVSTDFLYRSKFDNTVDASSGLFFQVGGGPDIAFVTSYPGGVYPFAHVIAGIEYVSDNTGFSFDIETPIIPVALVARLAFNFYP